MGANMTRRLAAAGIDVIAYDRDPERAAALADDGVARAASSVEELVAGLEGPRSIWIMVPAAFVGDVIEDLIPHLSPNDTIIDGGNTHYPLDLERARRLGDHDVHMVDVGTSGGVHGLERGYCLMIGGETEPVERLTPIFEALAPGVDAAERSYGRDGEVAQAEKGYLHCGPVGSGHFVKMVHNGIEYAMMAAYAEGFALLSRANIGSASRADDAETAPLSDPRLYDYDIAVNDVAEVWRRGSVIGSWLLDLTAEALVADPALDAYQGRVSDSGEGRWTALAAIETGTPTPTIVDALFSRFSSRDNDLFANKVLSAMRAGFGGHVERATDPTPGNDPGSTT